MSYISVHIFANDILIPISYEKYFYTKYHYDFLCIINKHPAYTIYA